MKKFYELSAMLAVLVLAGCATAIPDQVLPVPTSNAGVHKSVVGMFSGLTATDPLGANPCPGTDIDCLTLAASAEQHGVQPALLLFNPEVTWTNLKAQSLALVHGKGKGDMLVVGHSGHGGNEADDNGDEADGLDETLILWGENGATSTVVRDDRVLAEFLMPIYEAAPWIDVLLITDTCRSKGNWRAVVDFVTQPDPEDRLLVSRAQFDASGIKGGLIQIAMCNEDGYSYGSAFGGTGTQALLAIIEAKEMGRAATFLALWAALKFSDQVPQWEEAFQSADWDLFRNGKGFWR